MHCVSFRLDLDNITSQECFIIICTRTEQLNSYNSVFKSFSYIYYILQKEIFCIFWRKRLQCTKISHFNHNLWVLGKVRIIALQLSKSISGIYLSKQFSAWIKIVLSQINVKLNLGIIVQMISVYHHDPLHISTKTFVKSKVKLCISYQMVMIIEWVEINRICLIGHIVLENNGKNWFINANYPISLLRLIDLFNIQPKNPLCHFLIAIPPSSQHFSSKLQIISFRSSCNWKKPIDFIFQSSLSCG